jgi:hypothetical protein
MSSETKCSESSPSTPLATALVARVERDFPWTIVSRVERFSKVRRKERSGAAIAGRTVLPALHFMSHSPAFGLGIRKSTSRPADRESNRALISLLDSPGS